MKARLGAVKGPVDFLGLSSSTKSTKSESTLPVSENTAVTGEMDDEIKSEMSPSEVSSLMGSQSEKSGPAIALWLKSSCPDINRKHMDDYVTIFMNHHVSSSTRLAKAMQKNSKALIDWGIHEVDADDIISALRREELLPQERSVTFGRAGGMVNEDSNSPAASVRVPTSPVSSNAYVQKNAEHGLRVEQKTAENIPLVDYYMPEGADEYVYMVSIKEARKDFVWCDEIVGLCISIKPGKRFETWIRGWVAAYTPDDTNGYHTIITAFGDAMDVHLNAPGFSLKLEMNLKTLKQALDPHVKPEKHTRRMYYPEIGTLVAKADCVEVDKGRLDNAVRALNNQLETYGLMLAKLDKRIENEANEAARLLREEESRKQEEQRRLQEAKRHEREARERAEIEERERVERVLLKEERSINAEGVAPPCSTALFGVQCGRCQVSSAQAL